MSMLMGKNPFAFNFGLFSDSNCLWNNGTETPDAKGEEKGEKEKKRKKYFFRIKFYIY